MDLAPRDPIRRLHLATYVGKPYHWAYTRNLVEFTTRTWNLQSTNNLVRLLVSWGYHQRGDKYPHNELYLENSCDASALPVEFSARSENRSEAARKTHAYLLLDAAAVSCDGSVMIQIDGGLSLDLVRLFLDYADEKIANAKATGVTEASRQVQALIRLRSRLPALLANRRPSGPRPRLGETLHVPCGAGEPYGEFCITSCHVDADNEHACQAAGGCITAHESISASHAGCFICEYGAVGLEHDDDDDDDNGDDDGGEIETDYENYEKDGDDDGDDDDDDDGADDDGADDAYGARKRLRSDGSAGGRRRRRRARNAALTCTF